MTRMRQLVNKEIKDKTEQVVEDNEITMREFELFSEMYQDEPFFDKQRANIADLDKQLFQDQCIRHVALGDEFPEELTPEKYLLMYKKIWAILRHDLYEDMKKRAKELRCGVEEIPEAEFVKLYEEGHKNFEKIR